MPDGEGLEARLAAAGVESGVDPVTAWRALRDLEGPGVTVIDLYALAARPRGVEPHQLPREERVALARSVMPLVWPGFEITGASDRGGDLIRVVDYNRDWPAKFEEWRGRIRSVLGETAVRVEHVGSTSVPGLPAKPIVDIQVSVVDLDAESSYVPQLETLSLQLRSRDALHRYFRPRRGRPRDVHVHVCAAGSDWEREHLLFRDYLRKHERARASYAAIKREAAARWADDGWAYTDAKTPVVLTILAAAERERAPDMASENVNATCIVDVPPDVVFDVLADPAKHAAIDGTGWVREPLHSEPLTKVGQIFRMVMYHPDHPDGTYQTVNRVQVFDRPNAVSWKPGYDADDGSLGFGGWVWRYDLEPAGPDRTKVTLTYDWSAVPESVRERIQFPPFGPDHLANSLAHLAELACKDPPHGRRGDDHGRAT